METPGSGKHSSPIRIMGIQWCTGCWQWFSDKQIATNRKLYQQLRLNDDQSVIFIHRRCVESLKDAGVLLGEERDSTPEGGFAVVVEEG